MINIGAIRNISRAKKCPRGSVITGDGLSSIMFIILKGQVGVYTDYRLPGTAMVKELGAGDLFADPGLLQDKRAAYTTAALSEAIILPVEKNSYQEFLQEEPSLAFEIIKDLSLRLEEGPSDLGGSTVQQEYEKRDRKPERKKFGKPKFEEAPQQPKTPETAPAAAPASRSEHPDSSFRLFPEEHGSYKLQINNSDTTHLMKKAHTCPICKGSFEALAVRPSKLVLASTDADMRSRYKDIEPLYYEILTCPHCLYSALPDVFEIPDRPKQETKRGLDAIKNAVTISHGAEKDTESVFAGFYLALHCAPFSFSKYQLVAGKLLYKLSRLYQDAGDEKMEMHTVQKALDNYLYAYERIGISPLQEQQICILIGELYFKLGAFREALNFFFKAKTSGNSSPALKKHAEDRIYDIRDMSAANQ